MTVSANPKRLSFCTKLNDDGSNTAQITEVSDCGFFINNCYHLFDEEFYLRIHDIKKDFDTLEVGDTVVDGEVKQDILAVLQRNGKKTVYALTQTYKSDDNASRMWVSLFRTAYELKKYGYQILQDEENTDDEVIEITAEDAIAELAASRNTTVDKIRLKK